MLEETRYRVLILGIGNTGRQDDGLGWRLLDFIKNNIEDCVIEYRYQLQVEDAELISKYETIIFVDATKEVTEEGYYFKDCLPKGSFTLTTHALHPESIVYLCETLYHKRPKVYILGIQGYEWELKTGLSTQARINLNKAIVFVSTLLKTRENTDNENLLPHMVRDKLDN